jgi:multiple sugar transport system permease protein
MAVAEQGGQFTGISWRQSRRRQEQVGKAIALLVLCAIAVLFIVPLLWMFVTSLKPLQDVFNPTWIPRPAVWANYPAALTSSPFALYFRNTLIITSVSVIGNVLSSSLVAYSFARLRYPGRELVFTLVLATLLLPGIVTLVPTYILFSKMHWVNTFLPLTVPSFLGGGAFNIFLLRQFFRTIPRDMDEAAIIDGASYLKIWWQVILPMSLPALGIIAIFHFIFEWNDFFDPLIYLSNNNLWTVALGLAGFQAAYGATPYNLLMAASLVAVLPCIVLFFLAQRYFVQGIVVSGVKG